MRGVIQNKNADKKIKNYAKDQQNVHGSLGDGDVRTL
jgi:hypothetical protein